MKPAVILFALVSVIGAGLINPAFYPISLYGGFSYASPYSALINYHRARYYARKAHDLAKIRSGLYGVGNGFYGYRYGNALSKWVRPYPVPGYGPTFPSAGIGYGKSYIPSVFPSNIVGGFPLGNFYTPKEYGNSFSQNNFAYGKSYSYSNKNSNFGRIPAWRSQNIQPPSKFFSAPIPVGRTTPIMLDSGVTSFSPGYQYSYFVRGSNLPKAVQPPKVFGGYNSLYGTRYSNVPRKPRVLGTNIRGWNEVPVGTVVGDPSFIKIPFSDGSIYNSNYNDFPSKLPSADNKAEFGFNPYSVEDSFGGSATYSLLPPSANEFSIPSLNYDLYTDPSYGEFQSRYDTDFSKLGNLQNTVPGTTTGVSDIQAFGSSKSQISDKEEERTKTEDQDRDRES